MDSVLYLTMPLWSTCRPTACASLMLSRTYSKSSHVIFLLVRCSLTYISRLVMRGNCSTRKTLAPKLATLSATYLLVPFTTDVTTMRVETERMTPSNVRNDRTLCARRVSSAISIGSLREIPRDLTPADAACTCVPCAEFDDRFMALNLRISRLILHSLYPRDAISYKNVPDLS